MKKIKVCDLEFIIVFIANLMERHSMILLKVITIILTKHFSTKPSKISPKFPEILLNLFTMQNQAGMRNPNVEMENST